MCEHPNRELAMVTVSEDIWCDPCLVRLVRALNVGGLPTVASCCGHGHGPGRISLADGRTLLVLDPEWDHRLTEIIHGLIGCKPGRECEACAEDEDPEWQVRGDDAPEWADCGAQ